MSHGAPSLIKNGSPCIHMSWVVPEEKEAELDAFWKSHEAWMRKTHTIGCVFDDETKPRLLHYYIAKGKQMTDPMDPTKGTTGNVVYQMSETYVADEDIQRHMKVASEWEPFKSGTMAKYIQEYGNHTTLGTDKIFCGMAD
ncbi:hypothetical protein HOP50_04g30040 [Chloropicon primus]|uniref:Uncharacterized protein n=1 Tax=Chloropicon primus TaxID=1764295 RepID=A0A5B8MJ01_9CHLO|nr:hypothetical protein A3770_04p30040 [Chloropicon primus]UPQ99696.1 hypothetical protein HOP50_04g30040 [Chloropicon primus]|eukprot:QDZ20486.1 hypothetical protein A3770_04p30040 [Chloropicon primus]